MIDEIGAPENAEPWLREKLEAGERLMGFGHRVYRTYDPRARALGEVAEALAGENERLALARHVEEAALRLLDEYKPRPQAVHERRVLRGRRARRRRTRLPTSTRRRSPPRAPRAGRRTSSSSCSTTG